MSTQYPGFPRTAVRYWLDFWKASVGMIILLLITGALGALVVLMISPESVWLYAIAAAGFALNSAGIYVRDVREGDFDPDQTNFGSTVEFLALIVMLGAVESTVLFLGTATGVAIIEFTTLPVFAAILAAAFYPIIDLVLLRRGVPTPGALMMMAMAIVLGGVLNLHKSRFESLPVFGRKKRPQS